MRGDIAGTARISILIPGAADLITLLEEREVQKPRLFQADGHAEPAGARSHDRNSQVFARSHQKILFAKPQPKRIRDSAGSSIGRSLNAAELCGHCHERRSK